MQRALGRKRRVCITLEGFKIRKITDVDIATVLAIAVGFDNIATRTRVSTTLRVAPTREHVQAYGHYFHGLATRIAEARGQFEQHLAAFDCAAATVAKRRLEHECLAFGEANTVVVTLLIGTEVYLTCARDT